MTSAYEVRPTTRGRVIGLGMGRFRFVGSGVALALGALLLTPGAKAGPTGAQVAAGQATVVQKGNRWIVRAGDGSIINYSSFNLNQNEVVKFIQPGATARVLNRIAGDAPSTINGTIKSNGIVYFANPAGIIFGPNSVINVGGIYAAAGNISNKDFLSGVNRFTDIHGTVSNAGEIDAKFAALVGERVVNTGAINSPGGVIAMVAGNEVTLSERGGTISVKVDKSVAAGSTGGTPGASVAAIENSGTVNAARGSAFMVAGDMYSLAVKQSGNVKARNVRIEGQGNAGVQVSGTIDASNQRGAGKGGDVQITGRRVELSGATIDASGAREGGRILVGGDRQGKGALRNATTTIVDSGSTLNADASQAGNGGTVVVWSDHSTGFYGTASAMGGTQAGNGGFIETSGHINLDVRGASVQAHARSASGKGGLWMMDPVNVTIDAAPDAGTTTSSSGGTTTFDPDNSVSPAIVDVSTINAALNAGTNVTVITGSVGTDAGNITVAAPVAKTMGGDATFTLRAANNITVNSTISSTSSKLNVDLQANASGAGNIDPNPSAGDVAINAAITTNGGTFASSGVGYTQAVAGTVATGGGAVAIDHTGAVAVNGTLNASGAGGTGAISVVGSTFTAAAPVTSGAGGIALAPADPTSDIRINNGAGDFNLSAGTLANLSMPAASTLTIGAPGGTGTILIGSSGDVDLSGLNANITLQGDLIRFNGALAYGSTRALTLTTQGVQDAHAGTDVTGGELTLDMSAGSATLGSNVTLVDGSVLGSLTLSNASDLAIGPLTVGANLDVHALGAMTTAGDLHVTGTSSFVSQRNGGAALTIGTSASSFGGAVTVRSRNLADAADAGGQITLRSGSTALGVALLSTTGNASINAGGALTAATNVGGTLTFIGGSNVTLTSTPTLTLGGSIANGSLTITAPDVNITGVIQAGSGGITLQPDADNKTIGINSSGADFSLSLAELLNLNTSGTLTIGRINGVGGASIGGLGAVDLSSKNYSLTLRGGQATFQDTLTLPTDTLLTLHTAGVASPNTGTDVVIAGPNGGLLVDSSAAVDLTTQVANLAGRTSAGAISVRNTGALAITNLGAVDGIAGAAGADVTVSTTGDLAVDSSVHTTGLGGVTLTSSMGAVAFGSGATASTDTGTVSVSAATSITSAGGLGDTLSGGSVNLTATTGDIGGMSALAISANTLSATAGGDVNIAAGGTGDLDANITGGSMSHVTLTHAGLVTVGVGHTITAGASLSITANDLALPGTLVSGGAMTLTRATTGTIGLGDAGGDMTLSKAELAHITATSLTLGGTSITGISSNNVAEADIAHIGAFTLLALADGGNVGFLGMPSTFHDLTVRADDSINVNANLIVSMGALHLMADADGAMDMGGDKINVADAVTISTTAMTGGDMTLAATGGIVGAGSLTLESSGGLTIDNAISSMGALNLIAHGGITLNGTGSGSGVSITANDGVTISDDLTSSSGVLNINADANTDGNGTFTVAAGKTVTSTNNNINITAADVALDGMLNAGTATVAIAPSVARTIGLGTAAGDLQLSGLELSHITASTLTLGNGLTSTINIDSVAASDLANISSLVNLLTDDVNITGAFNTAGASLAIAPGNSRDIALGMAVGGLNLSNAELALITTHDLQLGGASTRNIFVNGVGAGDTANVSGTVTLLAGRQISFISAPSTFRSLVANANAGIHVNTDVTTTSGDLVLNGDANMMSDADPMNPSDDVDAITIASGRTLDSAGALVLQARSGASHITGIGSLTLLANSGITIADSLTTSSTTTINADRNADNTGTLLVSSGAVISTSGNDLNISAADLTLDGSINAGQGAVSITRSAMGTIGLGNASGDMTITNQELGRIIAGNSTSGSTPGLTIGGSTITGMTIDGVTATSSNGIVGTTRLVAGAGSMTFSGSASVFNALNAEATGGLTVSAALSTDSGKLRLDGNSDHVGNDFITLGANITADIPPASGAAPTVAFNMEFASDVRLSGNVVANGRDVKFLGKIDSLDATSRQLTVNSFQQGVTTFNGDIGTVNRLFGLQTNNDGITQLGGRILTNGSVVFSDAVKLTRDTTIDAAAGLGVFFNSTVDTAASSPTARSLTVLTFRQTAPAAVNFPTISFANRVGSIKALKNVFLNYDGTAAGNGRPNPPAIATIYARPRDSSGNIQVASTGLDMLFNTTGTFRMGQNEKLTVAGSLTINAQKAILGDLTTIGSMTVNAPDIKLQTRPGAKLLGNEGVNDVDAGLDFVSGGPINFTSTPTLLGSGPAPRFGTEDGGGDVSNTLTQFLFQAFGDINVSLINSSGTTLRTLDLRSEGPTNTNIASTIAGAIPRETRQNDVGQGVSIGQAEFEQIKQLGIVPRNATAGELVDFLTGAATYNDVPRRPQPAADDYTTVVNRLPSEYMDRLLAAYDEVFNKPMLDDKGRPVLDEHGKVKHVSRTQEIQDALLASVRRYREATKAKAGEIDPGAFRAYLEQNPQEAESLGYIRQLGRFLDQLDRIGLTARELKQSKAIILTPVRPRGIRTVEQFEAIIRAEPARVMK